MEVVDKIINSSDPIFYMLITAIVALGTALVYTNRYTQTKTVPQWIFKDLLATIKEQVNKFDVFAEQIKKNEDQVKKNEALLNKLLTIIEERGKRL